MADKKFTGSARGPMQVTVAHTVLAITRGAARCGTPQASAAYVAAMLDLVREDDADTPSFVTAVVDGVSLHAIERRRVLGE